MGLPAKILTNGLKPRFLFGATDAALKGRSSTELRWPLCGSATPPLMRIVMLSLFHQCSATGRLIHDAAVKPLFHGATFHYSALTA
jgi:hypothetical protein